MSTGADNATWVRPFGHADDGEFQVAVTPTATNAVPGWQHTRLRVATIAPGGHVDHASGSRRPSSCRSRGPFASRSSRPTARPTTSRSPGARASSTGRPTSSTPGAGPPCGSPSRGRMPAASPCAVPRRPRPPAPGVPAPRGRRGARRAARCRPGQPRGAQLRACPTCSTPTLHRLRGRHARPATGARGRRTSTTSERPGEETELEEIYYVETRSTDPRGTDAVGYQRVYGSSSARPIDVLAEVRTGDVVLVPHGWHGPAVAAPDADLYYLNVMAGPGAERAWRICDDPAHAWVRDTWADDAVDPPTARGRHPMTDTVRLTVAQAVVRFLAHQWSERDGERAAAGRRVPRHLRPRQRRRHRPGPARRSCGHEAGSARPAVLLGRNEQAMVHAAVGYAKQHEPAATWPVTASIGPGSTNMLTGAALATVNRMPGAAAARRTSSPPG